eukprot:2799993-Lingulodinium_polyedra.AAC.1
MWSCWAAFILELLGSSVPLLGLPGAMFISTGIWALRCQSFAAACSRAPEAIPTWQMRQRHRVRTRKEGQ